VISWFGKANFGCFGRPYYGLHLEFPPCCYRARQGSTRTTTTTTTFLIDYHLV